MQVRVFIIRLEKEHYLKDQEKINSFLEKVQFKKSSVSFVDGETKYWTILIHYEELSDEKPTKVEKEDDFDKTVIKSSEKISESDLTPEQLKISGHLKEWRRQRAEYENLPAFMILTNSDIYTVAKAQPQSIEDFVGLKGFGDRKIERYADEIIALLNSI